MTSTPQVSTNKGGPPMRSTSCHRFRGSRMYAATANAQIAPVTAARIQQRLCRAPRSQMSAEICNTRLTGAAMSQGWRDTDSAISCRLTPQKRASRVPPRAMAELPVEASHQCGSLVAARRQVLCPKEHLVRGAEIPCGVPARLGSSRRPGRNARTILGMQLRTGKQGHVRDASGAATVLLESRFGRRAVPVDWKPGS